MATIKVGPVGVGPAPVLSPVRIGFAPDGKTVVTRAGADYGAPVELVYLEPPLAADFERNERRLRPVPSRVIQRLVEKLEPPTWAEAHSLCLG